jgi:hypothetical protein
LLPATSNLNVSQGGQTRPDLVIVRLGNEGEVSFLSSMVTHLVADVAGYFVDDGTAAAGRLVTLDPTRIFDTRPGEPAPGPKGRLNPGETIDVQITGVASIPATGVDAVAMNLTAAATTGTGYVTAWPTGQPRPLASNLNIDSPGETTPNLVLVPVGEDGKVSFYNGTAGLHLLGDVTGYFTNDTAPAASTGLLFPRTPSRVFDTRTGPGPIGYPGPGSTVTRTIADITNVAPANASAVVANLTGTQAGAAGYITAWPTDTTRPLASSLNLNGPGDTRPNATLLPLGTGGQITLFTQSGAHLVGDTFGYFN